MQPAIVEQPIKQSHLIAGDVIIKWACNFAKSPHLQL